MNTFPVLFAFDPVLIPMTAIIMGISIPLLAIYTDFRRKQALFELHHKERLAAIEKGIELPPLPPEFLSADGPRRPRNPRRTLLVGMVWLAIGLGLAVALGLQQWERGAYGCIPAGIGLAYLIYYFVEGKNEIADMERNAQMHAEPGPVQPPRK